MRRHCASMAAQTPQSVPSPACSFSVKNKTKRNKNTHLRSFSLIHFSNYIQAYNMGMVDPSMQHPCILKKKLDFACLHPRRQETLSYRTTRKVVGVGTRDWPGHSNPNKAPRSHTIPPLRSAGWRDLRWELQAPPFPGRTFPAHTQRLWALQRAAPGHRPLSLRMPQGHGWAGRELPPSPLQKQRLSTSKQQGTFRPGVTAAHRCYNKPNAVKFEGTESGKQKMWWNEGN